MGRGRALEKNARLYSDKHETNSKRPDRPHFSWRRDVANLIALPLALVTFILRLLWLDRPQGGLIFDESFYVNAARMILGWPVPEGAPHADGTPGLDPNTGHLPLAKLMIAGSMRLFGDNGWGWRLPSVIFGTLAVVLIFLLVRHLSGRPWVALFSAFIFSFDNLVYVHSRIATLDIFMVTFMLMGLYAYLRGWPIPAGAAMALAGLAKINGVFGMAAILGIETLRFALMPEARLEWRKKIVGLVVAVSSFVVFFLGVLWILDHYFVAMSGPFEHIAYVYNFGVGLKRDGNPQGIESLPWQWLINQVPITYYKQDVNTLVDGNVVSSRTTILFQGVMNPYIVFMLPVAIGYAVYSALAKRDQLAIVILALFAATYGQSVAMALLFHRISYIFYFLPAMPALAAAIAIFWDGTRPKRLTASCYAAAILLGFLTLFPFRSF